jgi:hypothetical protein
VPFLLETRQMGSAGRYRPLIAAIILVFVYGFMLSDIVNR